MDKVQKENLYSKSILLIGPSGAGKSVVAEVISKTESIPRLCLDRIANKDRKTGFMRRFTNSDEYNSYLINNQISKAEVPGVVDFGAGHSIYKDKKTFKEIKKALKPFQNIVLLLPSEDKEESLKIMNDRSTGDTHENEEFLESDCNRKLATMIVYTKDKTPEQIGKEILENVKSKSMEKTPVLALVRKIKRKLGLGKTTVNCLDSNLKNTSEVMFSEKLKLDTVQINGNNADDKVQNKENINDIRNR